MSPGRRRVGSAASGRGGLAARARRRIGLLAALCLVLSLAPAPAFVGQTEAAWTDAETTMSESAFSALRLVPPQVTAITTCARPVLGLNNVLRVQWRWPAGTAPYSQFVANNALWAVGNAAPRTVPTTGPVSGVYTTTFSGSLLGDLLGGLLGQSYNVVVRTSWTTPGGQTWASPNGSTISVSVPPLIGAPTCTFANGS